MPYNVLNNSIHLSRQIIETAVTFRHGQRLNHREKGNVI